MEKLEDRDLCKECGGFCCKKCGCDYFVSDFDNMKIDYLEKVLSTNRVSVVAALDFWRTRNDKLICEPTLYLRARNINRGEIDLLSFKTTCASLEEDGCYYDLESRPSGGASLIPMPNRKCYTRVDREKELKKWIPYQGVLHKLVKRHTGKTVDNKLKEDVENLLCNLLSQNVTGVSPMEIADVLQMLPSLCEAYPLEYQRAYEKFNPSARCLVKKRN